MNQEAPVEPVSAQPPSYSILEKEPSEALSDLADYVRRLKDHEETDALSDYFVQANVMAAEVVKKNQIPLDFELKSYVYKSGKKIHITRRERAIYNFDRALEEIFRFRSEAILREEPDDELAKLSLSAAEEARRHLTTLRKAVRTLFSSSGQKGGHGSRSSYDVILSAPVEATDDDSDGAPSPSDTLEALERLEAIIFGATEPEMGSPAPHAVETTASRGADETSDRGIMSFVDRLVHAKWST